MRLFNILAAAAIVSTPLRAQALDRTEERLRATIVVMRDAEIAYLQHVVDIPSSTLNFAGVKQVGAVFRASFDSLGFTTRWVAVPDAVGRAGHLVAEHRGKPGNVRLLLIGHLDTVVEPAGANWVREDSSAKAVGGADMKGGDVVILYALKALQAAGALRDMNITIVFTGDEEHPGEPLDQARRALIEAGRESDVALAFEAGNRADATVARRGASGWRVTATGKQAHSADIVPQRAIAHGDLRFISDSQLQRTRQRMRDIVAQHLPGTDATITFRDEYPAMSPTPGNARLLALYDSASKALGYGGVAALDPGRRGAGDISFVAPFIDGLDGLGALGSGSHSPDERVDLKTLPMQTERAALLLYRLGRRPAGQFARPGAE